MKYDRRYIPDGGSKEGIKDFWEKTKSISKAVGKELLPILTAASAAAASEVVRRVIRGIDVKSTSKPLMQMHRQLTEGSSEVIPDPIDSTEGSGLPDYDAPSPAGPLAIAPSQRARVGRIGGEYVRPPAGTPKGSPLWKQDSEG
jgi:hypothetical protein